jgi:hypothetical protein
MSPLCNGRGDVPGIWTEALGGGTAPGQKKSSSRSTKSIAGTFENNCLAKM